MSKLAPFDQTIQSLLLGANQKSSVSAAGRWTFGSWKIFCASADFEPPDHRAFG